jgi:hypothetical protein
MRARVNFLRFDMPSDTELLERLYDRFNARDMEAALATMHPDVMWANGLEGGHVHGHDGVRDYWTRQWAMMDSRAEPTGFSIGEDGTAYLEVHLTARDLHSTLVRLQKPRQKTRRDCVQTKHYHKGGLTAACN